MAISKGRFEVAPSANNHFAWIRTQLALERTLMAATRTAVSLIGFGFTVAQFFQKLIGDAPEALRRLRPETPRNFGLALIAAGVLLLLVFTEQYRRASAYIRLGDFAPIAGAEGRATPSPVYLAAFVVIAIGVAAFVSVLVRL